MRKLLFILLCFPLLFSACKKEDATTPSSSGGLSIGNFHEGGVVFYLDGNGGGLVCDIQDLDLLPWGCEGILISGADGTAIGTGNQNTIDILAECTNSFGQPFPGRAAEECVNSTAQGYSDWFLPSKDELAEIYTNRSIINTTSQANGGASFGTGGLSSVYWSSSEHSEMFAFQQFFSLTGTSSQVLKSSPASIRAVRTF